MSPERPPGHRLPVLTEVIELEPELAPGDEAAAGSEPVPIAWAGEPTDVAMPDLSDPAVLPLQTEASPARPTAADPARLDDLQEGSLAGSAVADSEAVARAVAAQLELRLEARLREVLAPALARAADTLIREARGELSFAVRDLVIEALQRELARADGQRAADTSGAAEPARIARPPGADREFPQL